MKDHALLICVCTRNTLTLRLESEHLLGRCINIFKSLYYILSPYNPSEMYVLNPLTQRMDYKKKNMSMDMENGRGNKRAPPHPAQQVYQ
jgi:hypothetical protein